MYIFWDKQPTVDVDHVHELDHDVAHEEGDGQEWEKACVASLASHNHLWKGGFKETKRYVAFFV